MATKAKATTAKTPRKKVAVSTAASDSPAKKATTSTKLADEKETTAPKAAKSTSTTRRRTAKPTEAKRSAKEAVLKKTTETPSKPVAKVVRAKATKVTETDSEKTKSKTKRTPKAASAEAADKTSATKRTRTVKAVKESPKASEKKTAAEKKAKTTPAAAKEATTEKTTKSKAKAPKKTATRAKAKVVVKGKPSKAKAAEVETPTAPSPEEAKPVEAEVEVEVVEKEVPPEAGPLTQQEREELARINAELPKSSTQRAFEAAAELAPLVQSHKSNGGTEVNAHEAQKAAEYLMNSMATKTDERIVIDGITIPTQAELLEMPEEDYMNERQVAFFKWLLKQRESELKSNAGQTTENLRETTIAPDPADRATIEEEHALELRTRDRERKLLKKVQEALRRLENGEFGWCEETGEPIGIPRLLARPTATLSLEAQQRREQRQKLYGD